MIHFQVVGVLWGHECGADGGQRDLRFQQTHLAFKLLHQGLAFLQCPFHLHDVVDLHGVGQQLGQSVAADLGILEAGLEVHETGADIGRADVPPLHCAQSGDGVDGALESFRRHPHHHINPVLLHRFRHPEPPGIHCRRRGGSRSLARVLNGDIEAGRVHHLVAVLLGGLGQHHHIGGRGPRLRRKRDGSGIERLLSASTAPCQRCHGHHEDQRQRQCRRAGTRQSWWCLHHRTLPGSGPAPVVATQRTPTEPTPRARQIGTSPGCVWPL